MAVIADSLPRFIVIGAAKSATTWLQKQLASNPAVFLPVFEPHFFSREYELGLERYCSYFASRPEGKELVGEKSADYLSHPDAARRIADLLPDVKLVVQLRDPVERAYSDYKMLYRRGAMAGQPEEYLTSLDNPFPRFLDDGLYGKHLSRWLEFFPRSQVLAFRLEDLARDPRGTVMKVCDHIGAPRHFCEEMARHKENSSQSQLLPLAMRNALAPLKQAVRPVRGNKLFESVRSLFAREIAYPPLNPQLEARLHDFYQKDLELAERLIGIDLSTWKAKSPAKKHALGDWFNRTPSLYPPSG